MSELSEEELQELYSWIDDIPLSRQKRNITRDFSDGVLTAEVIRHFLPKLVDLHNYSPANAKSQKIANWKTLNRKVLVHLNFPLSEELVEGIAAGKSGMVEFLLSTLRTRIESYLQKEAQKKMPGFVLPPHPAMQHDLLVSPTYQTRHNLSWLQENGSHEITDHPNQNSYSSHNTISHHPVVSIEHSHFSQPSRIPLPANKKEQYQLQQQHTIPQQSTFSPQITSNGFLPPIVTKFTKPLARQGPGTKLHKPTRENSTSIKIRLAEKDQKLLQTQEYIQYLQMKVTRYEHLVQIKDMKIEELKKDLGAVKRQQQIQQPYQRR